MVADANVDFHCKIMLEWTWGGTYDLWPWHDGVPAMVMSVELNEGDVEYSAGPRLGTGWERYSMEERPVLIRLA